MPFLQLDGLTQRYGAATVLDRLSLSVEAGERVVLVGPSGSGKSTTLQLVAGLQRPVSGRVMLGGADLTDIPAERRGIVYLFQQPMLFPFMSVADNIGFGLRVRKLPKAEIGRRVHEALERIRLPGIGARRPAELSGGQQQRVALARALVVEPKVLLLDEPLSALDPDLRGEMRQLILDVQRDTGVTMLMVTHDQPEALLMADRVGVLFSGRLAQLDPPETILRHPATEQVERFLHAGTMADFAQLERRFGSLSALGDGSVEATP